MRVNANLTRPLTIKNHIRKQHSLLHAKEHAGNLQRRHLRVCILVRIQLQRVDLKYVLLH